MRGGKLPCTSPSWLFGGSRPIFTTYLSRTIDSAQICRLFLKICLSQTPYTAGDEICIFKTCAFLVEIATRVIKHVKNFPLSFTLCKIQVPGPDQLEIAAQVMRSSKKPLSSTLFHKHLALFFLLQNQRHRAYNYETMDHSGDVGRNRSKKFQVYVILDLWWTRGLALKSGSPKSYCVFS